MKTFRVIRVFRAVRGSQLRDLAVGLILNVPTEAQVFQTVRGKRKENLPRRTLNTRSTPKCLAIHENLPRRPRVPRGPR